MYLELKSRIPMVAARTHLGTVRIQEAQDAAGLSNERIARLIPVSERTWRRWKESGEIPTYALPAAARALNLEIRGAIPEPIDAEATPSSSALLALRQDARDTQAAVDALRDEIRELRQALVPGKRASG